MTDRLPRRRRFTRKGKRRWISRSKALMFVTGAKPRKGIPRAATWVEPEPVAQIAFMEWTRDGRLRHPSFLG